MKKLQLFFLTFLLSCSSAKVVTDYNEGTDFSKYKFFDFYEDNGENLNEFDIKRITDAIYHHLTNSAFIQSKTPGFLFILIPKLPKTLVEIPLELE
nr:DUF4136 domain-containing protein [Polaribacter septentrionalilitoris]